METQPQFAPDYDASTHSLAIGKLDHQTIVFIFCCRDASGMVFITSKKQILLLYSSYTPCRSRKVLVADIDYVMLGMPGSSLSDSALGAAGLPSVKDMLRSSRKAARLFKPDPTPLPTGLKFSAHSGRP